MRSSSTVASDSAWRCVRRTSSAPRASKISAGPPISEASASATPSRPLLGQHDPLQPLVRAQRPLQHRVVLVDEVRGRLLGDRDERHLVGHLDEREAELGGRLAQRLGHLLVREPGAEPEPREPVPGEQLHERALAVGVEQPHPGGQEQLAAGQPRRRVLELGDVHPADRVLEPRLARDEADVEVADEVAERQHRPTRRSAAARTPPRAPVAGRSGSPRTARVPRSAAARAGSPGRRGRRRGRSARA